MRPRQNRVSSLPRRKLVWARRLVSPAAGTPFAVDLLSGFRDANGGAQPVGSTITRVRGTVQFTHSGPAAADTGIAWGLVVDRVGLTAGEVPDPYIDPYADWMGWGFIPTSIDGGGATVTASKEIDVKSQRKMEELGETLWMTFTDNPALSSAQVFVQMSILLRLP